MLKQVAVMWDGEEFSKMILDIHCWRKECVNVLGCHVGSLKSLAVLCLSDHSHISDPAIFHSLFQELAQPCQML